MHLTYVHTNLYYISCTEKGPEIMICVLTSIYPLDFLKELTNFII